MMAIRTIGLSLGLIAGICLACITHWTLSPFLLLAIGLCAAAALLYEVVEEQRWREWPRSWVLIIAFICSLPLGFWRASSHLQPPSAGSLHYALTQLSDGAEVNIRGTICRAPELRKPGQLDVHLRVDSILTRQEGDATWRKVTPNNVLVRIYARKSNSPATWETLNELASPKSYGYRIELTSRYKPISEAKNPGEFDYQAFLTRDNLATRLRCHVSHTEILERSRGNIFMEAALLAKTDFLKTYKQTIRNPASRLVAAATLGTRRAVENVKYHGLDIAKTFRHAGVGHVLAVSGLHVSVVTILLYSLFRMAGVRVRVFVPALILFLILFALLTGARPSSIRAVIMNSVVLITLAYFKCGLRQATAIGLALSSFLILLRTPMVLFAPSFLLSYGAVLSLVLLAPPMDRWLCTFRGFSLLFFLGWFTVVMTIASVKFHLLIDPYNCIGLLGLLWLLTRLGSFMNHRWPRFWGVGLERIPAALRMFFGAQLAIQIGMMVPMSAWFFGQFPVAGVLVNLLAIPAIGLLVQLGMLTGLLGLVPAVGHVIALPFGAASTIIGEGFFRLAHAGATTFPFPATPRPTPTWIALYYGAVALIMLLDLYRIPLLAIVYRNYPSGGIGKRRRHLLWMLPLLLTAVPLWNLLPGIPTCTGIQCLAAGRNPILTITTSNGSAVVVNAGNKIAGERLLFDSLRTQGASRIKTIILCSADPKAGIEGCASLLRKMRVEQCLLPALSEPNQSFLDAIGDTYLSSQAEAGARWALQYETAFSTLHEALVDKGIPYETIQTGIIATWKNGVLKALPRYTGTAKRFASSAQTPLLDATFHDLQWLIITDTTSAAVKQILGSERHYDVVVLPDLNTRKDAPWLLKHIAQSTTPQVLIISGENENSVLNIAAFTNAAPECVVLRTADVGAVSATFEGRNATRLQTHLTDQELVLRPL